jgi:hypothetical protein
MKQKYFYSILLLLLSFFGFSQTLDQSNTSYDSGQLIVNPNYPHLAQSFTNGLTGTLSRIAIEAQDNVVYPTIAGDFELTIYQGEGIGGTVLLTHTFSVANNFSGELIIDFTPVPVTSGTVNTFKISPASGSPGRLLLSMRSGNVYGGGILYNGNFGPSSDYDLWFKTFVNVPTPATHLNFDGSNDFVNLGTSLSTALNGTTALTLEAWINPSALNGWNNIITDYDGSYHKFLLRVRNNNNIQFVLANGTFLNALITIPLNTWTHIAAVYDGTNMYVYVNGNLIASQAAPASLPSGSPQINIGSRVGASTENFTGDIDDLRVWNIARTAEQINGSMNCELQGAESGLIAYYNFNQGIDQADNTSITTLNAVVGPNGTLTNFALNGATSNWLSGSPVTTGSVVPGNATVTSPVTYNQDASASALSATPGANGTGLMWYTSATGGAGSTTAPTPSTATPGSTSYWVASTNANGCESERVEIVVNVNAYATHLNFDGANDFVVSANAVTNNTQNQTYQAWFRIPSIPTNSDRILQRGNDGSGGWSVQLDVNSTGRLSAGISASPDNFITGTTVLIPNTWYHATFVFENNNSLRLYLDGNLEASVAIGNRTLRNSDNRLRVGSGNIASEFFNGDIDEVRVWDVALSATDILATKDCELDNTQTNIVAYYKFNQGFDLTNNTAITTVTDDSGNGNNGTLTNFALTGAASNWASGSAVTTGNTCPLVLSSDNFAQNSLMVYPNPTKGFVNIQSVETVSVEVYDMIGKLILSKKIENEFQNLDLTNFPTGIYLLKATNTNGLTQTHKIIKE